MKEQVVNEWVERANHDLEVAKILFSEEEYFDVVLFHIHQAVEKYIKGFLIQKGWELKKIHDIETLITEAMNFDTEFQKYVDFGRKITAYYYEERYPPGPVTPYSREEIEKTLEIVEDIITRLKKGMKKSKRKI